MAPPDHELVSNYDILTYVMFLLPRRDFLSLMRTCRALYQAGMPLLVERGFFVATDNNSFSSYLDFLLADSTRSRFLKALDLTMLYMDMDEGVGKKMAHVLTRGAYHIKALWVNGSDASQLIGGGAVASLRVLSEMRITGSTSNLDFLKAMQSPISSLSFSLRGEHPYGQWADSDVVDFIANFKDTLEDLDLAKVRFQRDDIQFPKVHTLHVVRSPIIDPMVLHRCFPNIRILGLDEDNLELLDDEFVENTRLHNLSRSQETWTLLDTLLCSMNYAYLLGIRPQQPVRQWSMGPLSTRPQEIRRFQTLLGDFRPAQLSVLSISEPDEEYIGTLESLFPKSPVTHLSFAMSLTSLPASVEPATVTGVFLLWASKLELTFLRMRIECFEDFINQPGEGIILERSLTRAGDYIRKWDLESYVRQLAEIAPNLQHAFFTFSLMAKPPPPSFWEISREGSDVRLRSLTVEEARMVACNEKFNVGI